ncbi:hypothetical protein E2542_SST23179 [Spatholobus suberectus]|nr:hypothetical protein E2542_SST23179 [Spatholobus suberectus]
MRLSNVTLFRKLIWILEGAYEHDKLWVRVFKHEYLQHMQGSLNKFHSQPALRKRAGKIDQGILIIRMSSYAQIWSFTVKSACYKNQKKRVAEEETASKKRGLGIRLLPASEQDAASAAKVKFSSKFEENRKDKQASINAGSIFPGLSLSSMSDKRRPASNALFGRAEIWQK